MEVADQRRLPLPASQRCHFWLPSKRRQCANSPQPDSLFCGNHDPASEEQRVPCPVDPSHSVLKRNLDTHMPRCPMRVNTLKLEAQPFYKKGINRGGDEGAKGFVRSETKRNEIFQLTALEFAGLINKIKALHSTLLKEIHLRESFILSDPCKEWLRGSRGQEGSKLPFQEKHALQQASILGNMEAFGVLNTAAASARSGNDFGGEEGEDLAVVEFGAGRGYLTQMLADCYAVRGVYLVERRSYKLKADRSLRQKDGMSLERLRIDIEDLDLNGVETLRGRPYAAIGKHLCGPATDLTLRCCLRGGNESCSVLRGLTIATCCHHLCQWDEYINKPCFVRIGIAEEEFNAITWFSSWAVDGEHGSALCASSRPLAGGVEEAARQMSPDEKTALGVVCKEMIDVGRLLWLRERGLKAELVKYVPSSISPENNLLLAR